MKTFDHLSHQYILNNDYVPLTLAVQNSLNMHTGLNWKQTSKI